jgi:plasmid maintenance system killer protein
VLQIDESVGDIRSPPGNEFEFLKGDRKGDIRFGSIGNIAFAFCGETATRTRLQ